MKVLDILKLNLIINYLKIIIYFAMFLIYDMKIEVK